MCDRGSRRGCSRPAKVDVSDMVLLSVSSSDTLGGPSQGVPVVLTSGSEIRFTGDDSLTAYVEKISGVTYVQYSLNTSSTEASFAMELPTYNHDLNLTEEQPAGWVATQSTNTTVDPTGTVTIPAGTYSLSARANVANDTDLLVLPSNLGGLNAGFSVFADSLSSNVLVGTYDYSTTNGGTIPASMMVSDSNIVSFPTDTVLTFRLHSDSSEATTVLLPLGTSGPPAVPGLRLVGNRIGA